MSVLQAKNLWKSYRKGFIPRRAEVLSGVSFEIEAGRITGFLGANGAGKTTTLKCVLGLNFPDRGHVEYFDQQELSSDVKKRIGFLPERPYFYEYLTGQEFLEFYGQLSLNLKRGDLKLRIDRLLKRVDLVFAKDRALRDYSKGMLQKIGLAQALIHEPELVILDEPMAGLDPDGRLALAEIIRETKQRGTAVFFSSHLLNDVEQLCEAIVVLKEGKVVFQGKTQDMIATVSSEVEIVYRAGDLLQSEQLSSEKESQIRIQELIQEGKPIVAVGSKRLSLEEAFVGLAMRDKE